MTDPMTNPPTPSRENLWWRLLWMLIVGALMGVAHVLTNALAVVQFIIMIVNKGERNREITGFGKRLGLWLAKAASFQTAASDDKPWPWSPFE